MRNGQKSRLDGVQLSHLFSCFSPSLFKESHVSLFYEQETKKTFKNIQGASNCNLKLICIAKSSGKLLFMKRNHH